MTKNKTRRVSQHPLWRRYTNLRERLKRQPQTPVEPWQNFWEFAQDIEYHLGLPPSPQHKLHRRNLSQGWVIGNLCWALQPEVVGNSEHAIRITYKHRTQCLKAWSKELNLSYDVLLQQYHRGMPARLMFKQS